MSATAAENNQDDPSEFTIAAHRDPSPYLVQSAILTVILVSSSILGLTRQSESYPTPSFRLAFVANDAANLLVGVPILITSAYLTTTTKSLAGVLLWPGALAYHLYSSLTYIVALSSSSIFGVVFILHLSAVLISLRNLCGITLDGTAVKDCILHKNVHGPTKFGGAILTLWGALFSVRALGMLLSSDTLKPMDQVESAVCIADIVIGLAWIWGGVELYYQSAVGLGLGLLFQASALFVGLVVILVVRPFLVPGTTFEFMDVAVVAVMGLTVIIPFVSFLRIALRNESGVTGAIKKGK